MIRFVNNLFVSSNVLTLNSHCLQEGYQSISHIYPKNAKYYLKNKKRTRTLGHM